MNDIVIPQTNERDPRGVRRRMDGQGDGWANAHRAELGQKYYLEDIDALAVVGPVSNTVQGCAAATECHIYYEYEPDRWDNRLSLVRDFAAVAYFERKATRDAAMHDRARLGIGLGLWHARVCAERQPVAPRFFVVVGGQRPPWSMYERDIWTGDESGDPIELVAGGWPAIWLRLGLTSARNELRAWLQSSCRRERAA